MLEDESPSIQLFRPLGILSAFLVQGVNRLGQGFGGYCTQGALCLRYCDVTTIPCFSCADADARPPVLTFTFAVSIPRRDFSWNNPVFSGKQVSEQSLIIKPRELEYVMLAAQRQIILPVSSTHQPHKFRIKLSFQTLQVQSSTCIPIVIHSVHDVSYASWA